MKRRDFLKTSGLVAGIGVTGMNIARGANVKGDDVIKIGVVGCGGRARGALMDRLDVGDNVKLVAIADIFEENAKAAYKMYKEAYGAKYGKDKIALSEKDVHVGFDSYKKVIDSCDEVIIATTPAFRPIHYMYAVKKGKHVFMEKPCCVDARGYRMLVEANKIADQKGLCVVVGLQRHYIDAYKMFFDAYMNGKLGDLMYSRVYWNGGGIWERPRKEGDTEMKYQMRNWYHFDWLSGDNFCEQHVHNIDVGIWLHGKGDPKCHPIKCNAMGARQVRKFPQFKDSGYRYDHFSAEYTFADGTQMFSQCRQQGKCWNTVDEYFYGTKAWGHPSQGKDSKIWKRGTDELIWTSEGADGVSGFKKEHIAQAEMIRSGKVVNNGWYAATSTFTAVLGLYAAFSGQEVEWDKVAEKGRDFFSYDLALSWETDPPVMPDKEPPAQPAPGQFIYESSVPVPGVWKWSM